MINSKTLFIALLGLSFSLFSCGQVAGNAKETSTLTRTGNELWTLYSKQDSIYHVKRLLASDSGYMLLSYDINSSQPEAASQRFTRKESVDRVDVNKFRSENPGFDWMPFNGTPTLFVQVGPSAFKDEMDALGKRQRIEQKIDKDLHSKNAGSWVGGDLGPGGANMLFEVQNTDQAKAIIGAILVKEGLNRETIIGRRIYTAKDDWFYEVIYPLDYTGVFLTM